MNKKIVLWVLVGWGLALVLPPQRVMSYFTGKSGG